MSASFLKHTEKDLSGTIARKLGDIEIDEKYIKKKKKKPRVYKNKKGQTVIEIPDSIVEDT
tara:strand:- start:252 stop:434 length:183 start_codon:yes stop_codon:yes gene_type:complete